MTFDGNNFNRSVEDDITGRLYRLLRDLDPLHALPHAFDNVHEELLRFKPFGNPPEWQVAAVVVAGIYGRLREVARPHQRASVEERGDYPEFFAIQAKLDEEENEWRVSLGLNPVDSQSE